MDWLWYRYFNAGAVDKYKYGVEKVPQTLYSYMDGSRPGNYGKSWYYNVTTLYSPFFLVEKNHFVGLEINLVGSSIRVMDCNLGLYEDEEIVKELEPIATLLPILLKRTEKFSHLGSFDDNFTVVRDKTLPQDTLG